MDTRSLALVDGAEPQPTEPPAEENQPVLLPLNRLQQKQVRDALAQVAGASQQQQMVYAGILAAAGIERAEVRVAEDGLSLVVRVEPTVN